MRTGSKQTGMEEWGSEEIYLLDICFLLTSGVGILLHLLMDCAVCDIHITLC